MTLTRYGIREWGVGGIIFLLVLGGCYWLYSLGFVLTSIIIALIGFLFYFCLACFFRNPYRKIPEGENLITSPADGVVKDIEVVDDFNFPPFNGKALRVGIFLSVLNVHVNRAPYAMTVESIYYREGEYLDARHNECAKRNEAMTIAGLAKYKNISFPLAVRQISGAIARRIVCPVKAGRHLTKGEIYGMIKFGSRTEIYLPTEGANVKVKIGEKVYAGKSIIAELS